MVPHGAIGLSLEAICEAASWGDGTLRYRWNAVKPWRVPLWLAMPVDAKALRVIFDVVDDCHLNTVSTILDQFPS